MDMTTHALNPMSRKAVLILEGDDGTAIVTTVYNPRFEREFHDDYIDGYVRVRPGVNTIIFEAAQAFSTGKTDAGRKKAADVYAEARAEALLSEMSDVGIMPSPEDLMKLNFRTHEVANEAVYLAGIAAGAEMVKFHDERLEKEIAQLPLNVLDRAYSRMTNAIAASVSSKSEKGLKKARKLIAKLRQEFADGTAK